MIRRAKLTDVSAIVNMLSILHGESPEYGLAPRNRKHVENSISNMLYNDDVLFLIDDQQRGILVASRSQDWYAPTWTVYEQLVYVLPDYRGSPVALRLIRSMELWATEIGAKIRLGVTTGINQERSVEMYERLGYKHLGTLLQKRT